MAELQQAAKYLDELLPKEALMAATKAVAAAKGRGDKAGQAEGLKVTAEAHMLDEEAEKALLALTEALTLSQDAENIKLEARILRTTVSAHLMNSEIADALLLATEALAICRSLGDKEEEAGALLTLAQVHLTSQGPKEALKVAKEAVAQFHDSKSRPRRGEAKALQTVAQASLMDANAQDALQATRRALQLVRELGDMNSEAAMWNTIAQACLAGENFKKPAQTLTDQQGQTTAMYMVMSTDAAKEGANGAVQAAEKSLALFRKVRNLRGEAATLHTITQVKLALGKYEEALTAAKKAVLIFRKLEDKKGEAIALCSVGQVNVFKNEFDDSFHSLQEAYTLFQEIKHQEGEAMALNEIVALHLKKKEPTKALRKVEELVELCRKGGNKKGEAVALCSLSSVYQLKGDDFKALEAAQEMAELSKQIGDRQLQLSALAAIAHAYKKRGQIAEAYGAAAEAWKVAETAKTARQGGQEFMNIFDIYVDLENPQEAFKAVAEAQGLFFKAGNKKGEAAALLIAASMLGTGEKEVVKVAARAATLLEEMGDDMGRASLMLQSAVAVIQTATRESPADYGKAGSYAGSALRIFKEKGAIDMQACAMEFLAQLHILQLEAEVHSEKPAEVRNAEGHAREGIILAKQAVELFRRAEEKNRYAGALHTLSSAHLLGEDPHGSIAAAQEALELFEEQGDTSGEICALLTIASCYTFMRKQEAAVACLERGKALAQETQNWEMVGAAMGMEGVVQQGLGDKQTRRAAFFVQHPDTPYTKQCMELSMKLREMSASSANGKHLTILTRGVLSQQTCNPAPAAPSMLAQNHLGSIVEAARKELPRLKVGALDLPSGCSMEELGPSHGAAFMPTSYGSRPVVCA